MNYQSASSPERAGRKRTSSASEIKGAKIIKCGYCQNKLSAVPRDAVCLKCKRPANKPLSWPNKLLCLMLFPVGLLQALLMRPSRPHAAAQALLFSIAGAATWAAFYLLVVRT